MKTLILSKNSQGLTTTTKFTFLSTMTVLCFLLAGLQSVFAQGIAFVEMEDLSVLAQGDAVAEELPVARQVMIESVETKRYLFCTGEAMTGNRGDEGGWLQSPGVVGSDANYYNRAMWLLEKNSDGTYYIINKETHRYLFPSGDVIKGNRGDEGGWLQSPAVVGSDANYYDRAKWKIIEL